MQFTSYRNAQTSTIMYVGLLVACGPAINMDPTHQSNANAENQDQVMCLKSGLTVHPLTSMLQQPYPGFNSLRHELTLRQVDIDNS